MINAFSIASESMMRGQQGEDQIFVQYSQMFLTGLTV